MFSTRRQILRYLEWFNGMPPSLNTINATTEALVAALPAGPQPEWDY